MKLKNKKRKELAKGKKKTNKFGTHKIHKNIAEAKNTNHRIAKKQTTNQNNNDDDTENVSEQTTKTNNTNVCTETPANCDSEREQTRKCGHLCYSNRKTKRKHHDTQTANPTPQHKQHQQL